MSYDIAADTIRELAATCCDYTIKAELLDIINEMGKATKALSRVQLPINLWEQMELF